MRTQRRHILCIMRHYKLAAAQVHICLYGKYLVAQRIGKWQRLLIIVVGMDKGLCC